MYEVLECYTRICQIGIKEIFTWVPAHVGIKGNEMVDNLSKQASSRTEVAVYIKINKAETKTMIWGKIMEKWWKSCIEEKKEFNRRLG